MFTISLKCLLPLVALASCLIFSGCDGRQRASVRAEIDRRVAQLRKEYQRGYPLALSEKAHEMADANAVALIKIGMQAVPALLSALEDETPTKCKMGYGKIAMEMPGPDGRTVSPTIRVSDKANWILEEITGQDFMFNSDLQATERQAAIAKWREWWEKHKSDHEK